MLTALACAVASPALYEAARTLLETLGHSLFPMFVSLPEPLFACWPVAPGAALGAAWIAHRLGETANDRLVVKGIGLGMLAGLANVPLSVLFALTVFQLQSGWRYGYQCLLEEWGRSLLAMTLWGAPIALPLGALFGTALALAERKARTTRELQRPKNSRCSRCI